MRIRLWVWGAVVALAVAGGGMAVLLCRSLSYVEVLTVLLAGSVCVYSAGRWKSSPLGPFQFDVFFLLTLSLYSLARPVSDILRGMSSQVSEHTMTLIAVGLSAFLLGASLGRQGYDRGQALVLHGSSEGHFSRGLALFAAGAASYLLGFSLSAGGVIQYFSLPYATRYLLERGLGLVTLWQGLVCPGVVLMCCEADGGRALSPKRIILSLAIAFVLCMELLSGKRRLLLSLAVSLVSLYHMRVRRLGLRHVLGGLSLGWGPVAAFGYIRGLTNGRFLGGAEAYGDIAVRIPSHWADPGRMEFGYAFGILQNVIETVPSRFDFWLGRSYLDVMAIQLPLRLFPDRPISPTEWYVSSLFPSVYEKGGAFGFFVMAEGYLNFGLWGVFLELLLIGWLGVRLQRLLLARGLNGAIIYALLLPAAGSFIRATFAGLVKEFIIGIVVPVMLALMLGRKGRTAGPTPAGCDEGGVSA